MNEQTAQLNTEQEAFLAWMAASDAYIKATENPERVSAYNEYIRLSDEANEAYKRYDAFRSNVEALRAEAEKTLAIWNKVKHY